MVSFFSYFFGTLNSSFGYNLYSIVAVFATGIACLLVLYFAGPMSPYTTFIRFLNHDLLWICIVAPSVTLAMIGFVIQEISNKMCFRVLRS